jgi:hypothetical protein
MGFFSNLFKKTPPSGHPFPDLYDLELKISDAIKKKINLNVKLDSQGLTREKWEYLKSKFPQLDIPVTHEFNSMHGFYKKKFEKVKPYILANNTFSLTEYEEKILRAFTQQELPKSNLIIIRPTIIKTDIAGFRFHDYKKKAVKEMLVMDPKQELILQREPENKFDYFAVKLLWENYLLGYVPSKYSCEVTRALDEKKIVSCSLLNYYNHGPIDERTEIEIRIDDGLDF